MTTATDPQVQWDNETYQEFRREILRKRKAAETAREVEAAKRSEYAQARKARIKADAELFASIDQFSQPLPLLEFAAKNGHTPEPEPRPTVTGVIPPIIRQTPLADLVPYGPERTAEVTRLHHAGLRTAGDLLDRAEQRTDHLVRDGKAYREGPQLIYAALRDLGTGTLLPATVTAIGDAMVDADLVPPLEIASPDPTLAGPSKPSEPEKPKKGKAKPTAAASVKVPDTPKQVPASLFPDDLPEEKVQPPATAGSLEARIVEQVFAFCEGRHAEVVAWLVSLGCKLVHEEPGRQWTLDGLTGTRTALAPGFGPLDTAPVFGFLLAGQFWPTVYPRLMDQVDKELKRRKKSSKAQPKGAPTSAPESEGEPLPAGVTVEALMGAYITHRFANRKGGPPTVKPVEFDGKLWVVVGYAGDESKNYGFRCLPLVPVITWLDNHPGIPLKDRPKSGMDTHEDYLQFWTGVRVKVGRKEFAIDVAGEARTIIAQKTSEPAAAEPEEETPTMSAAFEGEYIGDLVGHGETVEQLRKRIEAAYISDRFQKTVKEPITVRPFALRGGADLYVNAGGSHQYRHSSYRALKLYHPETFKTKFPGHEPRLQPAYWDGVPDHERTDSYWGVRVRVGGKKGGELVIGPVREGRQLTTYPGKEPTSTPAGKCRVCGCVESDCRNCIERTGEPCSWTSPAKDLCSACKPLLQETVAVLGLRKSLVEVLEVSGLVTVGHLHGCTRDKLATTIGGKDPEKAADLVLFVVAEWIADRLNHTDDGTEMMPDDEDRNFELPEERQCCRCKETGGEIAEEPSLADSDEDLLRVDDLDMAITDHLGLTDDQAEHALICGRCYSDVTAEIAKPRGAKRKGTR